MVRVRFKDCMDVTHVVMHVPVNRSATQVDEDATALWHWVDDCIGAVPEGSTPIVLLDANGHVGSKREAESHRTGDAVDPQSRDGRERLDGSAYKNIGPHGAERENPHGRVMR